jgi:hypothetical protein
VRKLLTMLGLLALEDTLADGGRRRGDVRRRRRPRFRLTVCTHTRPARDAHLPFALHRVRASKRRRLSVGGRPACGARATWCGSCAARSGTASPRGSPADAFTLAAHPYAPNAYVRLIADIEAMTRSATRLACVGNRRVHAKDGVEAAAHRRGAGALPAQARQALLPLPLDYCANTVGHGAFLQGVSLRRRGSVAVRSVGFLGDRPRSRRTQTNRLDDLCRPDRRGEGMDPAASRAHATC